KSAIPESTPAATFGAVRSVPPVYWVISILPLLLLVNSLQYLSMMIEFMCVGGKKFANLSLIASAPWRKEQDRNRPKAAPASATVLFLIVYPPLRYIPLIVPDRPPRVKPNLRPLGQRHLGIRGNEVD